MTNTCLPIRVVISAYFIVSLCLFFPHLSTAFYTGEDQQEGGSVPLPLPGKHGTVVTKDQRWSVVSSEFGDISTVKVADGRDVFYHLQFITMEPNSLFLPAHLHSDMVFYVDSGSGTLSWVDLEKDSDKLRQVDLRTGDVYRLRTGSFFYLQSNLESERRKLRIYAIFSDSKEEIREGSSFGAYSSVGDLVLGFDNKVLQAAFNVDEEVIQELKSGERKPMIVHGVSKVEEMLTVHYRIMRAFLGRMENDVIDVSKTKNKSKKDKAYNILEAKHDVENCNGWSLVVTRKQLDALKDSDFGIFMVNLTKGAMMGPHWNPLTAEIAVVLSGRGMVHVVCPSSVDETECKNSRFRVEEGDVFVVPRYHPMAQISFNNESFVFMGFTTTQKKNHPQYLVGSGSVFQVLDKRVLEASLGVSNTTMDEILSAQREAIILECTSCAEEEERLLEEEIQRQKEEEARKREEEERKKEEEEEARRQEEEARREQEEARKREEEEAAREQEAKRRQEEEEARRQEEEARREQEEAQKREEEEAARKREEQEAKRQQEEEAARQRQQEDEAARQQEESRRREEEAAARRRQQEEEAARQQEEEATRRQGEAERQQREQQEEAARRRQEEEEAAKQQEDVRRQQEQEAARQQRKQEEEAARRDQEEEAARHQEAAARRRHEEERRTQQQKEEEVARQLEEEARRWREAAARKQMDQREEAGRREKREPARRQQEEEAARQHESRSQQEKEGARRQQHEEEARRQHEEKAASRGGGGGKEHKRRGEGEVASESEEAMAHRQEKAEAATRGSEAGGQGGGITSR